MLIVVWKKVFKCALKKLFTLDEVVMKTSTINEFVRDDILCKTLHNLTAS